jgi:hypothetical protein
VSLLAYRAATGGGLVHSLRRHAAGETITNPRALLLRYLNGAVGELRERHRVRSEREHGLPPGGGGADASSAAPARHPDPAAEIDASYGRVIDILSADLDRTSRSPRPADPRELGRVLAFLDEREKALLKILLRYAPVEVGGLAETWDDDTLRCVLLGIFPLDLPAVAVAGYRSMRSPAGPGASTAGTAKKIRRLRKAMKRAWPADQAPRRAGAASTGAGADHARPTTEEGGR